MATNVGGHKYSKNYNNWLHKHFEPQQVDVVVSSISMLGLELNLANFLTLYGHFALFYGILCGGYVVLDNPAPPPTHTQIEKFHFDSLCQI